MKTFFKSIINICERILPKIDKCDSSKSDFEDVHITKDNRLIEELANSEMKLLNNKPMIKLTEECISIMEEFEDYTKRLDNEQAKYIASLVIERVQESLERCGFKKIENESTFTILRHIPNPIERVPEGALIERTISPGFSLGNRVFRKAKVEIKGK